MKTHDDRYKYLFSLASVIESMLRVFGEKLGIPREVLERLDFRNMRLDSGEAVRPGFKRRQADMVWVIPILGGAPGAALVLMLEFQSDVDPKMLSRIARYVHLQLWERKENQDLRSGRLVPTFASVVVHNGRRRWNVATDSAQVSATGTVPGDMSVLEGRSHYRLLDIQWQEVDDLPEDESITWLVRLEQATAGAECEEMIVQALRALRGEEDEELEEALYEFAAVPDQHTEEAGFISFEEAKKRARRLDNVGEYDMGISLREWNTARFYADIENEAFDRERQALALGREEGREEEHEERLAGQRDLLREQAAVRFDDITAARLVEPLARIDDFDRLKEIGRWIVSCETGEELLSRLNGSGPRSNGSG